MWGAIGTIASILMWVLDKIGVSKERQDKIKREINIQVRKIIKGPSNSTIIRDQYRDLKDQVDDYLSDEPKKDDLAKPVKDPRTKVSRIIKVKCPICERVSEVVSVYPDGDMVLKCGHIKPKD